MREDGRLERHCEHGVAHTVGQIDWRRVSDTYHDCDGYCTTWKTTDEGNVVSEEASNNVKFSHLP